MLICMVVLHLKQIKRLKLRDAQTQVIKISKSLKSIPYQHRKLNMETVHPQKTVIQYMRMIPHTVYIICQI